MTSPTITTIPKQHCYSCGTTGKARYSDIEDRLFNVQGKWNLVQCENSNCGLMWLNPMPAVEDLPKLYENYYTHKPQKSSLKISKQTLMEQACQAYLHQKFSRPYNGSWLGKIMGKILQLNPARTANVEFSTFYLKHLPNGKLLEIGCGNGEMLHSMKRAGWDVTGVDFDSTSVNIAKETGLSIFQGDITEQHFPENSFDVIVMSHVIEHLPDPINTLQECLRLLRPEGKLVAITPNINGYVHNYMGSSSLHLDPPRHLHLFNKNSLENIAIQAGFKQVNSFSTIRDFSGLWWASWKISRHGKFEMGSHIPYIHKLWLSAFSILVGYALKMGWSEGDELVLKAKK